MSEKNGTILIWTRDKEIFRLKKQLEVAMKALESIRWIKVVVSKNNKVKHHEDIAEDALAEIAKNGAEK